MPDNRSLPARIMRAFLPGLSPNLEDPEVRRAYIAGRLAYWKHTEYYDFRQFPEALWLAFLRGVEDATESARGHGSSP